jgi:hypothetical protein
MRIPTFTPPQIPSSKESEIARTHDTTKIQNELTCTKRTRVFLKDFEVFSHVLYLKFKYYAKEKYCKSL